MEIFHSLNIAEQQIEGEIEEDQMERTVLFASHKVQLLNIFPVELWEQILGHLDDTDSENISNASPFFRKHLFSKRKLVLFSKALQHLVPYLVRSEKEEGTSFTLLECRMVCQAWNKGVDYYLNDDATAENIFKFVPNFMERHTLRNAQIKRFNNTIDSSTMIENLLRQLETHHTPSKARNPFIGQTVSIRYIEDMDQEKKYLNALTTMFQRYGMHIRCLTITLEDGDHTETCYSALAQWLKHAENVQFLEIRCAYSRCAHLNLNLPIFSSPKCKQIKSLNLLANLRAILVQNLVLRSSQNITNLEVYQEIPDFGGISFTSTSFPNLKKVYAKSSSRDHLLYLLGLLNDSQLHTLEIRHFMSLKDGNHGEESDAASLDCFNVLRICADKWGSTWEKLFILLPYRNTTNKMREYLRQSVNLRFNFCRLKHFKLDIGSPIHLDFLLGAKNSLQVAAISSLVDYLFYDQVTSEGTDSQIVQFAGYERRMYESNIWTMFPQLEHFETCSKWGQCQFCRKD